MEDLSKSFLKALLSALIRLEFYEDSELSFDDILDQADGRSSLSREGLKGLSNKFLQSVRSLASENPQVVSEFLDSYEFSTNELASVEELWAEEKGVILRKHLDKREIEWNVRKEPSWSIDIQTIGKNTESITLPIANFKFDLNKSDKDRTLQFSVEKNGLAQLLTALEQANLYLSSNLSS